MVTLSPDGTDISGYSFPKSFYLVPGMEGPGLPDHLESPQALRIPMENNVESINAALATGIALYLWSRGV
jgi:tRNA G18 (ribose-2'-O)-methylase SpoU